MLGEMDRCLLWDGFVLKVDGKSTQHHQHCGKYPNAVNKMGVEMMIELSSDDFFGSGLKTQTFYNIWHNIVWYYEIWTG